MCTNVIGIQTFLFACFGDCQGEYSSIAPPVPAEPTPEPEPELEPVAEPSPVPTEADSERVDTAATTDTTASKGKGAKAAKGGKGAAAAPSEPPPPTPEELAQQALEEEMSRIPTADKLQERRRRAQPPPIFPIMENVTTGMLRKRTALGLNCAEWQVDGGWLLCSMSDSKTWMH